MTGVMTDVETHCLAGATSAGAHWCVLLFTTSRHSSGIRTYNALGGGRGGGGGGGLSS